MPTLAVPQIVEQPADVRDNSLLRFLVAQTMAERKEEMKKEKDKDELSQHFNMLRFGVEVWLVFIDGWRRVFAPLANPKIKLARDKSGKSTP